jgi:hypothetical protein
MRENPGILSQRGFSWRTLKRSKKKGKNPPLFAPFVAETESNKTKKSQERIPEFHETKSK